MINPVAIIFWAFLATIGALIGGSTGALVGLSIGLGVSLIADLFL